MSGSPWVRHLSFPLCLLHLPDILLQHGLHKDPDKPGQVVLARPKCLASVCSSCSSEQGFAVWLPSAEGLLLPTLPRASMLRCSHTRDLHPRDNLGIFQPVPCRAHTMYIKNRRNSTKFKACGSYQTLCSTESLVLLNHLLFIY